MSPEFVPILPTLDVSFCNCNIVPSVDKRLRSNVVLALVNAPLPPAYARNPADELAAFVVPTMKLPLLSMVAAVVSRLDEFETLKLRD